MTPAPTRVVPAPIRQTLFTVSGRDAGKKVTAEYDRLEKLYQKAHQRRLPIGLFVSSWGDYPRTFMGITAHATPEQSRDLEFLRQSVSPSSITAS